MTVQDDRREEELLRLFALDRPDLHTRGGTDAVLHLDPQKRLLAPVEFEVKSSTDRQRSVTTVRDFGRDHLKKWEGKHWLIGFYDPTGLTLEYCIYGSPAQMAPWIRKMEEYVRMDAELASHLPAALTPEMMYELVGRKEVYTLADAMKVQKRQYSGPEYRRLMDLPGGYSPARMLQLLRDRARYLIERGSTLNNPHIPGSYFSGWERITSDHAHRLRMLVAQGLLDARAASTDRAT